MKISTGHWVDGDEFFGRERELSIMAEILADERASLLIPGPRRIGKTSIVKEFIRRTEDKYKIVYFDLESRNSVIGLCKDLIKTIQRTYPGFVEKKMDLTGAWNTLAKMLPELKISGVFRIKTGEIEPGAKDLLDRMEEVFEKLNEHNFIFAFDEFSDFLWKLKERSPEEVKFFLEWLRRLRQEGKIRLIVSGSINIISTVEELKVPDLINDLTDLEIIPLTEDEIRRFLRELTENMDIELTDDGIDLVVHQLNDGIPFFIQLFASGLRAYQVEGRKTYDAEAVKEIYLKITGKKHKEFIDLHSRLKDYLPPNEYKAARKILAHLASDPMTFDDLRPYVEDIVEDKDRLQRLLKRLTDECYLIKERRFFRFVSPMLADWWRNSYECER
ncbi:MAG: ATP-binding protein [Desulfobacterales bacterium]|nr:ATP-binding protein [Desulfobacterales bacterium]